MPPRCLIPPPPGVWPRVPCAPPPNAATTHVPFVSSGYAISPAGEEPALQAGQHQYLYGSASDHAVIPQQENCFGGAIKSCIAARSQSCTASGRRKCRREARPRGTAARAGSGSGVSASCPGLPIQAFETSYGDDCHDGNMQIFGTCRLCRSVGRLETPADDRRARLRPRFPIRD